MQRIDLSGRRYGFLVVNTPTSNIGRRTAWACQCDCGKRIAVTTQHLQNGKTHCGCQRRVAKPEEVRRAMAVDATRRYRTRHPDRVRASQKAGDQRPERKKQQSVRAAKKRRTDAYKIWAAEYKQRPEVHTRALARNKTEKAKARLARWRAKPESKAKCAERMRRARASEYGCLNNRMSVALHRGLKSGKQGRTWAGIVGYSIEALRSHLERQFTRKMSWSNMGKWHIDHIVPLSSFEFSSPDEADFKAAWALTNLRPLWAKENIAKSAKREVLL